MWKLFSRGGVKGQVSLDAVIAILFLLIIFSLIGYNVLNTANSFKESEKVERAHATIDVFENYVLTAYSKEIAINATFEPMGDLNYTIYFSNKSIPVTNLTYITFEPNGTHVVINGAPEMSSNENLDKNEVKISFGEFYVSRIIPTDIK